jgi:rSAM/selenodomain-associated transferase 1
MFSDLLLIFVKHPIVGEVKTRLAQDIGAQKALELYTHLLQHTRRQAFRLLDVERRVYFNHPPAWETTWDSPHFQGYIQEGEDLGERMHNAFAQGFADGFERIVIIGSDCPTLDAATLQEAFRTLRRKDAVLGPANDGGYYLLGMNRLMRPLFRHKEWSTETVLYRTVRDLQQNLWSFSLFEEQVDIDTIDDLHAVGEPWSRLVLPTATDA